MTIDKAELITMLIADSLMDILLVPIHTPYVYTVLRDTGYGHGLLLSVLTVLGYVIGAGLNYGLGRIITSIPMKRDLRNTKLYDMLSRYAAIIGFIPLLAFGWIASLATLLTLTAGILKMRFSVVILCITVSMAGYYGYLLYTPNLVH